MKYIQPSVGVRLKRRPRGIYWGLSVALLSALVATPAEAGSLRIGLHAQYWRSDDHAAGYRGLLLLTGKPAAWFAPSRIPRFRQEAQPFPETGRLPLSPDPDEADAAAAAFLIPVETDSSVEVEVADTIKHERRPRAEPPSAGLQQRPPHWLTSKFALALVRVIRARGAGTRARLDGLASSSRRAAWLPELRLKAGRSADQTLRYAPTTSDPERWLTSGGADLRYEAQATWSLSRLIFSGIEPGLERFRRQLLQRTDHEVKDALKALSSWQEAMLLGRAQLLSDEERIRLSLQEVRARTLLDLLSGGWFSRKCAATGS